MAEQDEGTSAGSNPQSLTELDAQRLPHLQISEASLTVALKAAQSANDIPATISIAEQLRHNYPKATLGYQAGANALRLAGRYENAAKILDQAAGRMLETFWLSMERIWLSQARDNWTDVVEQTRLLRKKFPDQIAGWRLGFAACRHIGDLKGGEEILQQVLSRARPEEWFLEGVTQMAARRGAWEEACAWAAELRAGFPINEHGYRIGLRSLCALKQHESAAALLAEADAAFSGRTWLLIESANIAQARRDWMAARQAWQRLREDAANLPEGYIGGFRASMALKQLDDAALLHRQAALRFSDTTWLMAQKAELAYANGSFGEATQLWASLTAIHPDALEGYHGAYRTFRSSGMLKDAEAVLVRLLRRFPCERWALIEFALIAKAGFDFESVDQRWGAAAAALPSDPEIAMRHALARSQDVPLKRRDWTTTRTRLRALNVRFPDYVAGWLEHVRTLRFMGALEEAENLAQACVQCMPDKAELWLEYARTTKDQTGHTMAQRLTLIVDRFPAHLILQTAYAEALAQSGRLDEANLQYSSTLQRLGHSATLLCGYAAVAMRQDKWPQALERWLAAQRLFPNDERVVIGLLDTHAALDERRGTVTPPPYRQASTRSLGTNKAAMFSQFESLGGTGQACEFGLVQRAAGIEPIGLLRWMHITPAALIEGLLTRFDGMGSQQQTIVDYYRSEDPENPEYRYRDTRFDTRMHTFVHKRDMAESEMFTRTCRRVAFLRRKMIEDLEAGEKIFVYKIYERTMDCTEVTALHHALRTYGSTTLLYLCYADSAHPSGSVEVLEEGLMIAYISGFNVCRNTHLVRAPDLEAWNAICETASRLYHEQGVTPQ